MVYDISEQYVDDIFTYHFLNITSDLIMINVILSIEKPQFCFTLALVIVNSRNFY